MAKKKKRYHTPGQKEVIVPNFTCSFCGKGDKEVSVLITAPGGVYICDSCIRLSNEILEQHLEEAKIKFLYGT
jgi:transcription elongation factor Elf1